MFIARRYIKVLEEYLPTILEPDSIFIYDNAPTYSAQIVDEWLEEMAIEVMEWLPYSPDLNPWEKFIGKCLRQR